jgi:endonuclease G
MRKILPLSSLLLLLLSACLPENQTSTNPPTPVFNDGINSVHLAMGNPSKAVSNPANESNFLLVRPQYALSYHRNKGIANWVSWHLDQSYLGSTERQDDFRPDTDLPAGWYQVRPGDYTGSGFDRGHTIPSADRTRSVEDNSSTFFMTNIFPQAPDNNQGPWERFETYCRNLVRNEDRELYIISGGYGIGGTGSNGPRERLADGRVIVPSNTWKVVLILQNGTNDLTRVNENTRVIAIDMPNIQGIRNVNWGTYRVSVDDIEARTGLDLLSNLPESLQAILESRVDDVVIP